MKDYKVIHGSDLIDFIKGINEALKLGYSLIGGISMSHDEHDIVWYAQAVAKPKQS